MSNKTIAINPSLFSISNSKTKKNKEKKSANPVKPLINPNILKNKLLKRIKEHKQRETESIDIKKKEPDIIKNDTNNNYTDEFNESINYLQTLSKQKKVNDEKTNYEKQKQKKKELLEKKTIKNRENNVENLNQHQYVNIDLPEELKISINSENKVETSSIVLNKYKVDNVPYGILKGGIKPTYRNWSMNQRNNIVTNPNVALTIQNSGLSKEKIERESRLQNLREKLKNKKNEVIPQQKHQQVQIITEQKPEQKPQQVQIITEEMPGDIQEKPQQFVLEEKTNILNEENIGTKKITKRTIKRKYTLGKSSIKKAVGVLIKDRRTRKHIINAQKELKKKPINEIKTYLRDHNLIKIGSNAPNDVIRKLYESSMLSGEITNSNSEILLHNFSKEDKEF